MEVSSHVHPFGTHELQEATNISSRAVTQQPNSGAKFPISGHYEELVEEPNLLSVPRVQTSCPPGLEYLTMVDQLVVHQKIELLEVFLGCEMKNKYDIKNSMGQMVYTAEEDTDCCTRNCLGNFRPFDLRIRDHNGQEVINLYREFRCNACCFPCCLQRMEVYSPPGVLVGVILQEWTFLQPKFRVENAAGEAIFMVNGPCCTCRCCADVDFPVSTMSGLEVGKITKQWSGLLREMYTNADHFAISFPLDLDVTMKAVLMGALFLIDYNYFERPKN